jgi:diphosphomevalonate decarboxylase
MSGKTMVRYKDPEIYGNGMEQWSCPSNIALIKYWGKRDGQIPMNPNLSLTLEKSITQTTLNYAPSSSGFLQWDFKFEGKCMPSFESKIETYLLQLSKELPFLDKLKIEIDSSNTFPHSAGIASSASAMGALALCFASIEKELFEVAPEGYDFYRRASYLARLGSGSASRSVFGNYSLWGKTKFISDSSDYEAVGLKGHIHPYFQNIEDAILVVSPEKKRVSSSAGHALMDQHPYAKARYVQANDNLGKLLKSLELGDKNEFIRIVENEALSLHALMLSSSPSYFLLKPATISLLEKIRQFRNDTGTFMAFTLDAGPNIHLLYHEEDRHSIYKFIAPEIKSCCVDGSIIMDRMGEGPRKVKGKRRHVETTNLGVSRSISDDEVKENT